MKYLNIILIGVLLLTACQQEEKQEKETTVATTPTVTEKQPEKVSTDQKENVQLETHGHGHSHAQSAVSEQASKEKFRTVEPQIACEAPVVIEFYAYQCPHCYNLEPFAEAWRKKNAGKVNFLSVPTHLGRQEFGSLLLVHHAAKKLGILDKAQHALFERVHKEKKLFGSPEEAADFLVENGADRAKALTILADQEAVTKAIQRDFDLLSKYKVTHVPQVLVNHQYMSDISSAGGKKELFELVDELLTLENNCQPEK